MAGSPAGRRLDGWKAIAGYFKRDRSTVMRWADDRNLPVRRMPGGSVFALEHELAAWATEPGATVAIEPAATLTAVSAPNPSRTGRIALLLGALILIVGAAIWLSGSRRPTPGPDAMPRSSDVASTYVLARDTWARRTPADIAQSIKLYGAVLRREPDFAPAHAGLAEAWLLFREYGEIDDMRGYGQARVAAERALALDSTLPAAHRAIGFIHYWWDNDPRRALADFARALALDDRDGQTHFWYANVLADLGLDAMAQREYDRARLLRPGWDVVEVEQACSQAMAGRIALGRTQLQALARQSPGDPTVHGCLAWIAIGAGDIAATAREYAIMAKLRGEPGLTKVSADLTAALARDPATAHRVLIADQRREIASGARRLRQTPAYVAAAMGDRAELLVLLREAAALGEHWYTASMTQRMAERWRDDAEVSALIARLRQPIPTLRTR